MFSLHMQCRSKSNNYQAGKDSFSLLRWLEICDFFSHAISQSELSNEKLVHWQWNSSAHNVSEIFQPARCLRATGFLVPTITFSVCSIFSVSPSPAIFSAEWQHWVACRVLLSGTMIYFTYKRHWSNTH